MPSGICVEEVDETALWLELISEENILPEPRITPLHAEATEFLTSIKTARDNK